RVGGEQLLQDCLPEEAGNAGEQDVRIPERGLVRSLFGGPALVGLGHSGSLRSAVRYEPSYRTTARELRGPVRLATEVLRSVPSCRPLGDQPGQCARPVPRPHRPVVAARGRWHTAAGPRRLRTVVNPFSRSTHSDLSWCYITASGRAHRT